MKDLIVNIVMSENRRDKRMRHKGLVIINLMIVEIDIYRLFEALLYRELLAGLSWSPYITLQPENKEFFLLCSRNERCFVLIACRIALSKTCFTPLPVRAEHS